MNQRYSVQKRYFKTRLLVPVFLSLLITGCGNKTRSPEIPDPIEACSILSVAEVEALIGAPVNEPQKTHKVSESHNHWMSMCNYFSDEKNVSLVITLMPHDRTGTASEAFALYEAELKENLGDNDPLETVEGIGERAGWSKSTKQLTVFEGPYMLIVGIQSRELEGADALAFNSKFARKVLEKLPGK